MTDRSYASLLRGLKQAVAIDKGELASARTVTAADLPAPDVAALRQRLGLSQEYFAAGIGVPVGTLRNWEQGVRVPRGPARVLLHIVEQNPRAVFNAVAAVRERAPDYRAAKKPRK
jgi:putative transcriptional regulator